MKRRVGQAAAAMVILALGLAVGCGNFFVYPGSLTGSSSSTGDYVYVANASTETLAGFSVSSATLTATTSSPYSLGFIPNAVAVNPANTIVFVAGISGLSGFINAYSIGSGGALSLLVSNNVGVADEVSIDISPDGQWLLGLDANGPAAGEAIVDKYQINSSTGQLTLGTGAVYAFPTGSPTIVPLALRFAPNGDYVFAAVGTAGDLVFPFTTSNGTLSTPLQLTLGTGTSDNALAVNASSTYLYIARSGTLGGLAVYMIGGGGALSEVTGSPLAAGSHPFSVVLNKAGTDVYVANQLDGTISEYSIASSGAVAALSPATITAPSVPWALAVDNSGDYLFSISNAGGPDLSVFSYDSTTAGKLDLAAEGTTGTDPTQPVAIAATH